MPKVEVSSTRPRLRWYSGRPRYVIAGTEYEGTWRQAECVTVDVPPGSLHVSTYYIPWHPLARLLNKRLRHAEIDIPVPVGDATVALEFRPSRMWSLPGKLRPKGLSG